MESECEMCGCKDMTGTWHHLCFTCVGKLKGKVDRLEDFVALCKSLTGSFWPQNETTELLAKKLAALEQPTGDKQ